MVVRPDSGHPPEMVVKCLELLGAAFGTTTNAKGFKMLPSYVRLIQGDGTDETLPHRHLFSKRKGGWGVVEGYTALSVPAYRGPAVLPAASPLGSTVHLNSIMLTPVRESDMTASQQALTWRCSAISAGTWRCSSGRWTTLLLAPVAACCRKSTVTRRSVRTSARGQRSTGSRGTCRRTQSQYVTAITTTTSNRKCLLVYIHVIL